MSEEIGRLIRTTNESCNECSNTHLQLRARKVVLIVKGEEIEEESQYLFCSICENEIEYKDKKINKNKHREVKEIKVKEVKNGRYKERPNFKTNSVRGFKRGN